MILDGEPGFIGEEILSWEVVARLHFEDKGEHPEAEASPADLPVDRDRHSRKDKKDKTDKKDKKGKKDKKRVRDQPVDQHMKRRRVDHRPSHRDR